MYKKQQPASKGVTLAPIAARYSNNNKYALARRIKAEYYYLSGRLFSSTTLTQLFPHSLARTHTILLLSCIGGEDIVNSPLQFPNSACRVV
jgi:hypothetical protein